MRNQTKLFRTIVLSISALALLVAISGNLKKEAGKSLPELAENGAFLNSFHFPTGVAVDGSGNVYITEWENHIIRKMSPDGEISTFAGSGEAGFANGNGTEASFNQPTRIAIDKKDNLYVIDQLNHSIRKITPSGKVSTLAGSGHAGSEDARGSQASFFFPKGIGIGPEGNIYVADFFNNKIRKITPEGEVSTFAGTGQFGYVNGKGSAAHFAHPHSLVVDETGNVYVTEWTNHVVRKITADGMVSTFAGSGKVGKRDGMNHEASFDGLSGIALDQAGNIYVSEEINQSIRKITTAGVVTTIAGNEENGQSMGNENGVSLLNPLDMTFDGSGNLLVADHQNHSIRVLTPDNGDQSKSALSQSSSGDSPLKLVEEKGASVKATESIQASLSSGSAWDAQEIKEGSEE